MVTTRGLELVIIPTAIPSPADLFAKFATSVALSHLMHCTGLHLCMSCFTQNCPELGPKLCLPVLWRLVICRVVRLLRKSTHR